MSAVKLPSAIRSRQRGAIAQLPRINPIRIVAPGRSVGTGPGQGRIEGENIDVLEQHRLDTMQAPPVLRVEESPPRDRGSARGRGARGRGRGVARGVARGGARGVARGGSRGVTASRGGVANRGNVVADPRDVTTRENIATQDVAAGRGQGFEDGRRDQGWNRGVRPVSNRVDFGRGDFGDFGRGQGSEDGRDEAVRRENKYAPAGAYARVMEKRRMDISESNDPPIDARECCPYEQRSSPSYSPDISSVFIIRDEDAYSPSRPFFPELTDAAEIIDYTGQIKIESGHAAEEVDELEEDEIESEADDSMKQSSTLLYLKSNGRAEMKDCWSKDPKIRGYARCLAYCAAVSELSDKDRRATSCIWRDDGMAVDWVLDHQEGSIHIPIPLHLSELKDQETRSQRKIWTEEQMAILRDRYPSRTFRKPFIGPQKIRIAWTNPSASSSDIVAADSPEECISDPREQGMPPQKRARSPSPTTARKLAKASRTLQLDDQPQQTTIPDNSYILAVPEDFKRERLPASSLSHAKLLEAAAQDMKPWVSRNLSILLKAPTDLRPLGPDDPEILSAKHRKSLLAFVREFLSLGNPHGIESRPEWYHQSCTISVFPTDGETLRDAQAGEPEICHWSRPPPRRASNPHRKNPLESMKYSDFKEEDVIAHYLTRSRAKKTGIWWISFEGFLGRENEEKDHFIWRHRRTLVIMVKYLESEGTRKLSVLADYTVTKRCHEAALPQGWRWISAAPKTTAGSLNIPRDDEEAGISREPEVGLIGMGFVSTASASNVQDTEQQPLEQQSQLPDDPVDSVGFDEEAALQKRMEAALELQNTWQEIKAAAPGAVSAVKKLAELEEEIVGLHMRLVALRKRVPSQSSSTAPTATTGGVSDLHLAGGVAQPFFRMAGDKIRFILNDPARAQTSDIAIYSMRGVVQHITDKPADARSRAVSSILENGLRVVDGCTPKAETVVMVVERNATAPVTKSPQQLLLWDRDAEGNARQTFLPKAPHSGNPSCIVAIGSDDEGRYRFASGGTTDRKVILWDMNKAAGEAIVSKTSVVQRHASAIRSLAFEPTNQRLFGGTTAGRIFLQDLAVQATGTRTIYVNAAIFHIHTNSISPETIAVEAEQTREQFYIFDTRTPGKRPTHRFGYDINLIPKGTLSRFDKGSYQGNYFARGYGDGTVRMWDLRMVRKHEQPYMVAKASSDPIRHVVLDGRKLRVLTQTAMTTYDNIRS